MADVSEAAQRWWPWDRLGLDPTADARAIRRVYAKLLRTHHPETDPEGYQSLREAYEAALAEAPYVEADAAMAADADDAAAPAPAPANEAAAPEPRPAAAEAGGAEAPLFARARLKIEPVAGGDGEAAQAAAAPAPQARLAVEAFRDAEPAAPPASPPRLVVAPLPLEPPPAEPAPADAFATAERLLAEVDELLTQPRRMREAKAWAQILHRPEMDAIDVRHEVAAGTLGRLVHFATAQPWGAAALEEWHAETWRLLDSVFDWTGSEIRLAQFYSEHELDPVMKPLRRALPAPARPPQPAPDADAFAAFLARRLKGRNPLFWLVAAALAPLYPLYWILRKLMRTPWWAIVVLVIGVQFVRWLAK